MSEEETERTEGVDFSDVQPIFEKISYPITKSELVEQYGDQEIDRTNADPITIRELLEPMGEDTFESDQEVQQGLLNMMPMDSEGRQRYSDRGLTVDDPDDYENEGEDSVPSDGVPENEEDTEGSSQNSDE